MNLILINILVLNMRTIYKITLTYIEDNKSKEISLVESKIGSLSKIWCYHKEKYN